MRTNLIGLILCSALLGIGCGDDDGGSSGGPAASSCYDVCGAQAAAESAGDCALFTESECKTLCDAVVMQGTCLDEFQAMNECWLTGTFSCGLFSAESDAACDTQDTAYNDCSAGGGSSGSSGSDSSNDSTACAGAEASGRCPQVTCPCDGGDEMISGSESTASGCACLDEVTCKDLCF